VPVGAGVGVGRKNGGSVGISFGGSCVGNGVCGLRVVVGGVGGSVWGGNVGVWIVPLFFLLLL
jgi:hypothetical protein